MSSSKPEVDLQSLTALTLDHYNKRAADFWIGTCEHNVTQNIDALLRNIEGNAPFSILDFGCGPGRDLKTFREMGHQAIGLDGAEQFVKMAHEWSGCEIWQQDFLNLQLPAEKFDGVFANASLFHVPREVLPDVLKQLFRTLKPRGVLFSSNPRGNNEEGWSGDRYGVYHDFEVWQKVMLDAGFTELEHYYRPPGLPLAQQPWLASVWRKNSSE